MVATFLLGFGVCFLLILGFGILINVLLRRSSGIETEIHHEEEEVPHKTNFFGLPLEKDGM